MDFNPAHSLSELAGLIYLSQGIDPDSGTSLFNRIPITQEIEEDKILIENLKKHGLCFVTEKKEENLYM